MDEEYLFGKPEHMKDSGSQGRNLKKAKIIGYPDGTKGVSIRGVEMPLSEWKPEIVTFNNECRTLEQVEERLRVYVEDRGFELRRI